MRIVTGGGDDSKCYFNAGPPFKRVASDGSPLKKAVVKPSESCHERGAIHCVRYNPQGSMIASVGTDKSVCFYEGKNMELVQRMEAVHKASIYACAWNGSGDLLLTCSADGTAKLISSTDFKVVQNWDVVREVCGDGTTKVPQGMMLMGCAFVRGNVPVAVSMNGHITILPMSTSATPTRMEFLTGHQSPISSMALDYANGAIYTGDSDGVICVWDINTGEALTNVQRRNDSNDQEEKMDQLFMNKVHKGAITGLTMSKGNASLLSIGWDDKIRYTDSNSPTTTKTSVKLESQPNQIRKGTTLVVVMTVDGLILMRSDTEVSDLFKTSFEPTAICVSADDHYIYVGGKDNSIHIYRVNDIGDSLDEVRTLSGTHSQPIYALSLSNDGTKLASADVRDVCVWDVENDYSSVIGKGRWCFHNQRINVLAWSNDDTILASAGNDDSIFIWSLQKKMKRIQYSFAHRAGITGLEFMKNSDGMILTSVGNDSCMNRWDITDDVIRKFG